MYTKVHNKCITPLNVNGQMQDYIEFIFAIHVQTASNSLIASARVIYFKTKDLYFKLFSLHMPGYLKQ